jgi:O-antigen ligase
VAYDANLAIFDIFLLLQAFLLFFYIVGTVRTRQDVLYILIVLLTGLILESLVMIGLRLIGHSVTIANITASIEGGVRVSGTIGSPNSAASYLTLLLAPAFSLFIARLNPGYKWLAVFAFGLGGVALVLTLSRGGWLAFILSIGILSVLAWYRGWLRPIIPLVGVMVAVLAYSLFQDTLIARLFGDDDGSTYSRVPLMRIAFRMIQDHPVLGVGTNNYAFVLSQYITPDVSQEWLYVVHNKYLLVWAETGLVALIAYIWFLLATIWRGWQGWRLKDRVLSPLALGFTATIVGQMAHMNVDVFNGRPHVQMLWLIAGLITAISRMDLLTAASAAQNDGKA